MRFLTVLVAGAVLCAATEAWACGGTFCSRSTAPVTAVPLVQAGERVLFIADEQGDVEAHIQINFTGDPTDFAWVVPVPSQPTLSVGSDQVFGVLDQVTQPQFKAQTVFESCRGSGSRPVFACGGASSDSAAGATGTPVDAGTASNTGVTEISSATVGPFETKILSATDPGALTDYLRASNFDVTPEVTAVVTPYVEKKSYFVALKLRPEHGTGDLQPIVLRYHSDEGPCVPIRMTAIAAARDMGILVYVLGTARAVSSNYLNLVLNETRLDWFQGASKYQSLVTEAADEAGGHGFVTDYAGSSGTARSALSSVLQAVQFGDHRSKYPATFTSAALGAVQGAPSQNVLGLLRRCAPLRGQPSAPLSAWMFSPDFADTEVPQPACGDDFQHLLVEPLQSVIDAASSRPALTRLFTTLSPDEMTEDPIFVLNPELPQVPLLHNAVIHQECTGDAAIAVPGTGTRWTELRLAVGPDGAAFGGPALLRAEEMSARGQARVRIDNTEKLRGAPVTESDGGCSASGVPDLSLIGLFAMLFTLRRRRAS